MQSGIDTSRARIQEYVDARETKIDIRPDRTPKDSDFFGKDGLSFRDVVDAINPLNHIPIVSDVMKAQTGHHVSTASRLVGGTLLGGPIGFVASLASIIFEEGAGASPAEAAYAAITGEETTQVASNASTTAPSDAAEEQVASLDDNPAAAPTQPVQVATLDVPRLPDTAAMTAKDKAVLDLYGNSNDASHAAYKQAQLLPYLREVNRTNQVL
jgi:hypothetical protein